MHKIKEMNEIPSHRVSPSRIATLTQNDIFVFGSNLSGVHSSGAAHLALQWGAVMGQGIGQHGRTYAIPTMFDSVEKIAPFVIDFIDHARQTPHLRFLVTEIGCGIAGFSPSEIAPLFHSSTDVDNVLLPQSFWEILQSSSLSSIS